MADSSESRGKTHPLSDRCSADDSQNVRFLHDQQFFAVDLDFGARPFAEQDLVASLDVERLMRSPSSSYAPAYSDDFAFLRLFLGAIGDDDPASGLFLGLDAADEDAVVQRTKFHDMPSLLGLMTQGRNGKTLSPAPEYQLALALNEC
jgi:hypothetical protein